MRQYVGNLVDRDDSNYESYAFASADGKDAAIARFIVSAKQTMEEKGIAEATLKMTEDGIGIGSRDLENPKYKLKP